MVPADRFLHGRAAGTPLSPTTALLARAGVEEAWALRLALAACLLAGAAQQASAVLFLLWSQLTLPSLLLTGLLLGAIHVWDARWIVVPPAPMGLLQLLGLERRPAALAPFPLACALALLVGHLDRAAAERKAGGGAVTEPPSA